MQMVNFVIHTVYIFLEVLESKLFGKLGELYISKKYIVRTKYLGMLFVWNNINKK